eukprot:364933-Chlamydomonas_euryale.AAC.12
MASVHPGRRRARTVGRHQQERQQEVKRQSRAPGTCNHAPRGPCRCVGCTPTPHRMVPQQQGQQAQGRRSKYGRTDNYVRSQVRHRDQRAQTRTRGIASA